MSGPALDGLFLYASDAGRLAGFYEDVVGMRRLKDSPELIVLQSATMQLVVHQIPAHIAATFTISVPAEKREDTALKFFFTVPSLDQARSRAAALGGEVFTENWTSPLFTVCNAMDPEGNVFQLREAAPSL